MALGRARRNGRRFGGDAAQAGRGRREPLRRALRRLARERCVVLDLARHRRVPRRHVHRRVLVLFDERVLQQLLILGPVLAVFRQTT